MHTGTLLTRRNDLLTCDESIQLSDQLEKKFFNVIEFKDTDLWKQAYKELKDILSNRENLPNKEERNKARIERANNGKSNERRKNS